MMRLILPGINTKKVEIFTYIFGGILSAIAGLLISVRVGGAFLGMGDSYLLETVGGVVIGGTLISGGKASPIADNYWLLLFNTYFDSAAGWRCGYRYSKCG